MSQYSLLINGELVQSDQQLSVINPATEEVYATCPRANETMFNHAVASAKNALPSWQATSIAQRQAMLNKLADKIDEHTDELAKIMTQEQGKALTESIGEVLFSAIFLRAFAAMDLPVEVLQDDETGRIEIHRKPLGVVAGIVPWNFPLLIAAFKLAPAVLAGNTFVLKPSATTPLCSLKLGEYCQQIFPAGVVNVVTDDNDLGHLLTAHPDIAKISFTGSTVTGKKVAAAAIGNLKRITLELGGNDAGIVLDDVNVKEVAPKIFQTAFMNCGQVCIALKRLYVHRSIYQEMVQELSTLANAAIVGNGLDEGVTIGPIQNKTQYAKLKSYFDAARGHGTISAGGSFIDGKGYFVQPTIVSDISEGNILVDEEPFGPILPVLVYDDVDEAIARANNTPYGLGGSVWSSDIDRATKVANQLDCGTAWVNQHLVFGPNAPFAGAKESGIGVEFTEIGFHEFTQVKVMNIAK